MITPGNTGSEDRGNRLARIHMEAGKALEEQANGNSTCPRLVAGFTFKLDGHDFKAHNREYLLVGVSHTGQQPQALEEQSGSGAGASYSNNFLAIPSTVAYRPLRTIDKPFIQGHADRDGRGPQGRGDLHRRVRPREGPVPLGPRWGRTTRRAPAGSRTAQAWGGGGWGAQFIPRVGDEVLVDFMEGDPDWPIIVGSVYNEANQPHL